MPLTTNKQLIQLKTESKFHWTTAMHLSAINYH